MIELIILTSICGVFVVAGLIADYILPGMGVLERWFDSLPMEDD